VENLGKKARAERAAKIKKFWEDQPELKPVYQNARISQLTHRVVHDQVLFATISQEMTVNDTYVVAFHLIKALKEANYNHPMMMQFDAMDPLSGHTFSIITNVRLAVFEQGINAQEPVEILQIRNTTIKANTLRLDQVKKSEQESPILNDLDYYSRPYNGPDPFLDGHFVDIDHDLELKKLRCFDSNQERERVEEKLRTFEADP